MKTFKFDSKIKELGTLPDFTDEQIKNEPMLFNCDFVSAYHLGGAITKSFLNKVEKRFHSIDDLVIDSRVHMLMPGWFPCIPGFHHDDVPRSGRDGQPNYFNPEYKSEHILALVNGDICPTEFALGEIELPDVEDGIYYKQWHPMVEQAIENGTLKSWQPKGNAVVYFDWQTFHQGVRAVKNGWRWFGRLSWNTDRTKKCTNEIRKQVQIYLEHPMEGW